MTQCLYRHRRWSSTLVALCLALALTLAAVALAPQVAQAQGNLLTNPGFETGSLAPWVPGGNTLCASLVITSNPHSGVDAAQIGGGSCFQPTLAQAVRLTEGVTYTLSAWTRGGAHQCKLGYSADSHLAQGTFGPLTAVSTTWSQLTWTF